MPVLCIGSDSAGGAASAKQLIDCDGEEVAAATLGDIAHILNTHTVVRGGTSHPLLNDGCRARVMNGVLIVVCDSDPGDPNVICQQGIPVRRVFDLLASDENRCILRPGLRLYTREF